LGGTARAHGTPPRAFRKPRSPRELRLDRGRPTSRRMGEQRTRGSPHRLPRTSGGRMERLHVAPAGVRIRGATRNELAAICAIYNHYVETSTCTYDLAPETLSARTACFEAHDEHHPITVALSERDEVVGWGALSAFRDRAGYDRTVENSVYVRHDFQGR